MLKVDSRISKSRILVYRNPEQLITCVPNITQVRIAHFLIYILTSHLSIYNI